MSLHTLPLLFLDFLTNFAGFRNGVHAFDCVWVADGCIFQSVQLIHCLPVAAWHQMPVGVYGDLDAMVPHLFFHVGQGFTVLDEQRGEGMPEVMNADMPES